MPSFLESEEKSKDKIFAMCAPEACCISNGRGQKLYEFGNKVSIATTVNPNIIVGPQSFAANHYDGMTLSGSIFQVREFFGDWVPEAYVDRGYKGYQGATRLRHKSSSTGSKTAVKGNETTAKEKSEN